MSETLAKAVLIVASPLVSCGGLCSSPPLLVAHDHGHRYELRVHAHHIALAHLLAAGRDCTRHYSRWGHGARESRSTLLLCLSRRLPRDVQARTLEHPE